jgi:hypothetical protein
VARCALSAVASDVKCRSLACVEDRVRAWKDCDLTNCLIAWTQLICLHSDLARAEPKTLRYRLFHVAAYLAHRGRQLILRIDQTWPSRSELHGAYNRLRHSLP